MDTRYAGSIPKIPKDPSASLPKPAITATEKEAHLKETADKIHLKTPRLIFLTAPTSSGKSSIMAEFEKCHENAKELGTDDFEETHRAILIATHFKKEYATLSQAIDDKNLWRFLFSPPDVIEKHPEQFFKTSSDPKADAENRKASLAIYDTPFYKEVEVMLKKHKSDQDEEHFKAILKLSASGKTVIFDTPNAVGFFEYLKLHPRHAPVERFLVYAPLTELVKRLPGRNAQADATGNVYNKRQYIDILNQFKHLYHPTKSDADVVVATLKREDIEKIFKDNEDTIKDENTKARTKEREDLVVEKEQYLKHFGLDIASEVSITTDFQKFDGIFHTATQTAAVSADQLSKHKWKPFKKE
jgi:hypothetical protein